MDWLISERYRLARLAIGLVLIAAIIYAAGPERIAMAFAGFDLLYLIPSGLLFLAATVIGGFNVKLLADTRAKMPFAEFMRAYLSSWIAGSFAPGRIGDFSFGYFARGRMGFSEASAVIFLDKTLTLFVMAGFSMYAVAIALGARTAAEMLWIALAVAVLFAALALAVKFRSFAGKFLPKKIRVEFLSFAQTLEWLCIRHPGAVLLNAIGTVIRLFVQAFSFVLLFEGLGVKAGVFEIASFAAVATLASLLPFTLNGIGVKEGVFSALCLKIGIPLEKSVAKSLISMVLSYGIMALLAAFATSKGDEKPHEGQATSQGKKPK